MTHRRPVQTRAEGVRAHTGAGIVWSAIGSISLLQNPTTGHVITSAPKKALLRRLGRRSRGSDRTAGTL